MKTKVIVLLLLVAGIPVAMMVGLLLGIQLRIHSGVGLALVASPFMALVGWCAVRIGNKDVRLGGQADPIVKFGIPSALALGVGLLALKSGDVLWALPLLVAGIALAVPLIIAVSKERRVGPDRAP